MRGLATNGLKMAITSENSNQKENQSNAGQHGLHGATKQKFNFYDYYSKKLAIQDKNVSKKTSDKWQFHNCCLLVLNEKTVIKPNQIFGFIKSELTSKLSIEESKIASISQLASSKNWQIQFKNSDSYEASLGKSISINGVAHTLIDANSYEQAKAVASNPVTLNVFLRIHWLPFGFVEKVVDFIKTEASFLTVQQATADKWEAGKSSIENGIISVKVKYNILDHDKFLDLAGVQKVHGQSALFQISGAPVKCLYCKVFGHLRKDCPKLQLKCSKCNKRGHNESECSLAKRLSLEPQVINDNEDLVEESVQEDSSETNKNVLNAERAPNDDWFGSNDLQVVEIIPASVSILPIVQNPQQTIEVKKESLSHENIIDNPNSKTKNPTFSKTTFNKIRNTTSESSGAKTSRLTRPSGMDKNYWATVELPRLQKEKKDKAYALEIAAMNEAAHAAAKSSLKRQASTPLFAGDSRKPCGLAANDSSLD